MTSIPESDAVTPAKTARKNRWLLILITASFVIPFIAGDLAYRFGWYKGGQTNHGVLISPPIAFADLALKNQEGQALDTHFTGHTWWLLYVLPENCDQACKNRLYQMRQVDAALGKDAVRLRQVIVQTAPLSEELNALIAKEFSHFERVTGNQSHLDTALNRVGKNPVEAGYLYIMDPMGWLMMRYDAEKDEAQSVVKAEDILNDMKKLLKASRIG